MSLAQPDDRNVIFSIMSQSAKQVTTAIKGPLWGFKNISVVY